MTPSVTMPARRLGTLGPRVPAIALGSWNTWDRMTFDDALVVANTAISAGANLFDVAYYNMGPHAENATTDLIFGRVIRELGVGRDEWLLCGKLWLWDYPKLGFAEQMRVSLERIGVERADIVVVGDYFGEVDVERIVVEATAEVAAGRFAHWGVNNWHIDDLLRAIAVAREKHLVAPCFAQLKYGPARRSMAEGPFYGPLLDAGLGLQASDVLEGGVLLGNTNPARKIGADVGGIRDKVAAVAPRLKEIAASLDVTPAQLAIAFCLANPRVGNVLVGVSKLRQLADNLGAIALLGRVGAARLGELTAGLVVDGDVPADGTPYFP